MLPNNLNQNQQEQTLQKIRKKVKYQELSQQMEQQIYLKNQKIKLISFLKSIQQYPKITALMIQHQQRSIKTLPLNILQRFTQLKDRVPKSIQCYKINTQFLQNVRISLENNLKLKEKQKNVEQQNHSHNCQTHDHSHARNSVSPNTILNLFNHLSRQYSQETIHQQERYFVEFIKETIAEYLQKNLQNLGQQNFKTLVLGCGMGRTIFQINKLFSQRKLKYSAYVVQGHQQDAQYYLFSQYMLNYHSQINKTFTIFPYIHNFSNHLQSNTPYLPVNITYPHLKDISKFPLTFGPFAQLYRSHTEQWSVIVSTFFNYSVKDVLLYIQIVYKILKKGGIWIDISTASFQSQNIPYFSYGEYQKILDKSQFKLIKKFDKDQLWYRQPKKIMKQWRKVYYRVMIKQ